MDMDNLTHTASYSSSQTKKGASKVGLFAACLFGFLFLGAGLAMLSFGVHLWKRHRTSATWPALPAKISQVHWHEHRSQKGGRTYSVGCTYRFSVNGREYTSHQIDFIGGSSSNYQFHRNRYELLETHRQTQNPILARVNPQDPTDSVLFRGTGFLMFILPAFGLVFAGIGASVFIGGIRSFIRAGRRQSVLLADPMRPWRAEERWNGFTIQSGERSSVITRWVIAGIFCTADGVFFGLALSEDHLETPIAIFLGVSGVIAAGLIGFAIYTTLRYLKYGTPQLLLTQFPISLGQPFAALLVVPTRVYSREGVRVELSCQSKYTSGSGKNRRTTTSTLWTNHQIISNDWGQEHRRGSALPFRFEIPADQPPRDSDSNPSISWNLEAQAATPGIDFKVSFEDLPFYAVTHPDAIERHPESPNSD